MGNFAENLNLGNCFRPPPVIFWFRMDISLFTTENSSANERLQSVKFYLSLSAQIKQHNRYSSIINNFKIMNSALILSQIWICKNHQ